MTCTGFAVRAGGDCAWAWADTEIYASGEPSGHQPKVFVNSPAALVGIGTGRYGLLLALEAAVRDANSFDQAADAAPAAICDTWAALVRWLEPRPSDAWQRFALVGYSEKLGRLVGVTFGTNRGPATIGTHWSSPTIEPHRVTDEHSVIAAVTEQMLRVQRDIPGAGAGSITLATVTRSGAKCRTIFELTAAASNARQPRGALGGHR